MTKDELSLAVIKSIHVFELKLNELKSDYSYLIERHSDIYLSVEDESGDLDFVSLENEENPLNIITYKCCSAFVRNLFITKEENEFLNEKLILEEVRSVARKFLKANGLSFSVGDFMKTYDWFCEQKTFGQFEIEMNIRKTYKF